MATATGRPQHSHRSSSPKPIIIVQGGQWGSEAKGLVCHKLTLEKEVDLAIRTGTVNAGHTVYFEGRPYAMQQLPVSWVRPRCKLVLGPGAYIHPDILMREIEWIMDAYEYTLEEVLGLIYIDHRCGIHLPVHTDRSTASDRHHKMGATGKGCSEAVVDKIMGRGRDEGERPLFSEWVKGKPGFWPRVEARICNTVTLANQAYDNGEQVLLEGTQGTLLDLHLGDYPFTTHKQTQAASWMAEAGLSVTLEVDLWLVMRTYPIRVAGNSGPLPGELSWTKMARMLNEKTDGHELVEDWAIKEWIDSLNKAWHGAYPEAPSSEPAYWPPAVRQTHQVAASELHKTAFLTLPPKTQAELLRLFELTTVTKKLRRIGEWDWGYTEKSLVLNRPTHIAITFMNYKWPKLWGAGWKKALEAYSQWGEWVDMVSRFSKEKAEAGPVGMLSFGPQIEATHMNPCETVF